MNPDLLMIHFKCPFCRQPIEAPEAMQFSEIKCPACQKKVMILKPEAATGSPTAPPPITQRLTDEQARAQVTRRMDADRDERSQKIRNRARLVCNFSLACFVIMAVSIIGAVVAGSGGGNYSTWSIASSGFFSLGISLQIIGQIMHIRANTEK